MGGLKAEQMRLLFVLSLVFLCFSSAAFASNNLGDDCSICKTVLGFAEHLLSENATQADIEKVLDDICNILPSSLAAGCNSLINTYAPEIVSYIIADYTPDQICQALKICTSEVFTDSDIECTICKFLVTFGEDFITENKTENAILSDLEKVCSTLPSAEYRATCVSIINTFGPEIITLVLEHETTDLVCSQIKCCPSALAEPKAPVENGLTANVAECGLCEFMCTSIELYLKENSTDAEIVVLLDDLCTKIPYPLNNSCKSYVDQYAIFMIQLVIGQEPPEKICGHYMHVCNDTTIAAPAAIEVGDASTCSTCTAAVSLLEGKITGTETEAQAAEFLSSNCPYFQDPQLCYLFADSTLATCYDQVRAKANPNLICKNTSWC